MCMCDSKQVDKVPACGLYKYTEWLIFKKKEKKIKGHEVRRGRQQVLENLEFGRQ